MRHFFKQAVPALINTDIDKCGLQKNEKYYNRGFLMDELINTLFNYFSIINSTRSCVYLCDSYN